MHCIRSTVSCPFLFTGPVLSLSINKTSVWLFLLYCVRGKAMRGAVHYFSFAWTSRLAVASDIIRKRWQNWWKWIGEKRLSISKYRRTSISHHSSVREWILTTSLTTSEKKCCTCCSHMTLISCDMLVLLLCFSILHAFVHFYNTVASFLSGKFTLTFSCRECNKVLLTKKPSISNRMFSLCLM